MPGAIIDKLPIGFSNKITTKGNIMFLRDLLTRMREGQLREAAPEEELPEEGEL